MLFKFGSHTAIAAAGAAASLCCKLFIPYVTTLFLQPATACRTVKEVEPCSTFPAIPVPSAKQTFHNLRVALTC